MIGLRGLPESYSNAVRPVLSGFSGAVSTAHPLATAAAQEQILAGGSAADAVVAAQAVLSVIAPESCGLGGDAFVLVRSPSREVFALNAAGASATAGGRTSTSETGTSVTVPGMVAGWERLLERWGRFPLSKVLLPAIRLAEKGFFVRPQLCRAIAAQLDRLIAGGAKDWILLEALNNNFVSNQPQLAATLRALGREGPDWFYNGDIAQEMCAIIQRHGGSMEPKDFASHASIVGMPLSVRWKGYSVYVPPPMSQGVLLGMVLTAMPTLADIDSNQREHIGIELTESAFSFRHRVVEGAKLLSEELAFNPHVASNLGGPRAYLHTAGATAADAKGLVVSSLASLFDDFGSAIHVPSGGFVLNNRGSGFTSSPNEFAPGKIPVHTLAPILVQDDVSCTALVTPGADGQVQSLLQVLLASCASEVPLDRAIHQPRWRSEDRRLIIETSHPAIPRLAELGHNVVAVEDGDARLGSINCAGIGPTGPFAVSDWRRESWSGVA